MTLDPDDAVSRNLDDAGCDASLKDAFTLLHKAGKKQEQVRLLRMHRKELLGRVHEHQKKIDCLDVLLFRLGKDGKQGK